MSSWVVADGSGTKYRSSEHGIPTWVDDIDKAMQFARRADAEKYAEEDEDAWRILPHFPVRISETAADRIQELLAANTEYLERARKAEAALENIARWKYPDWGFHTTKLELVTAVFDLMNYASAAKARLFDPRDFKVGEQPMNIEITVMDISKVDWAK